MSFVYHIRRDIDAGNLQKGYIGVTDNPKIRLNRHLREGNSHLINALSKYSDINMELLYEGEDEFCYLVEQELRPSPNLGWNIAVGGGKPPSFNELPESVRIEKAKKHSLQQKGRVFTEDHKSNMSKAARARGVTKDVMDKINIAKAGGYYIYRGTKYPTAASLVKVTGFSAYMILKYTKINDSWSGISFINIKEN